MVDDSKRIVANLSTILPTELRMILDSKHTLPCITYFPLSNISKVDGDTVRYSNVSYQIDLWAKSQADIANYGNQIDEKMKTLGYNRIGCKELISNDVIDLAMTYKGLGLETI